MDSTISMQFFLESKQPIDGVLRALAEELRFSVSALEHDDAQAPAFGQITDYTQGYRQGFLISWPAHLGKVDVRRIGQRLASRFHCHALVELDSPENAWLVVSPDGNGRVVNVSILDDGIEVDESATESGQLPAQRH